MPKKKATKVSKRVTPKAGMSRVKTKTGVAGYTASNRVFNALCAKAEEAGLKPKKFIDGHLAKIAGLT